MNKQVIYLAGGCFWGIEHLMHSLNGVIDAISGYLNGDIENPTYKRVCEGDTNFKEAVKVIYDADIISLEFILYAYFYVIHPEQKNRQGNDIGTQYQAGVYYIDEESRRIVDESFRLEMRRHKKFYVEKGSLKNFYEAEEYHQRYLDKNPNGYCHVPFEAINSLKELSKNPRWYKHASDSDIKKRLSKEEYDITQNALTEPPFNNKYWNSFKKGIYVDIVTGEPLFSSLDKFESSCGWPAFSKPIYSSSVVDILDLSHGMVRTEVKSLAGGSHLGHVFEGDSESPNGVRYCINSSSLRFIPYENMEEEGYGYLMNIFD